MSYHAIDAKYRHFASSLTKYLSIVIAIGRRLVKQQVGGDNSYRIKK